MGSRHEIAGFGSSRSPASLMLVPGRRYVAEGNFRARSVRARTERATREL